MEAMRYGDERSEEAGFVVEFRDGLTQFNFSQSIAFKMCDSDTELLRNEWMDVIEESHYLLTSNPIPSWIP